MKSPLDHPGTDGSAADRRPHRGRYAPSPTGRLHLGNARTALLAWLYTRRAGGRFVMRIEDNDFGRSRPEFEERIYRDLEWLGLDWDEGPDVGGPHGPYRQSEREAHYLAAVRSLETFACTCTRRQLRALELPRGPGGEIIYPGTCRGRRTTPDLVMSRDVALRWSPPAGEITARDGLCGTQTEEVATAAGAFVLRRRDGAWAYQLAVVVDDGAMDITHVVRGADLWTSTPRQILLQRALGLPEPAYVHVPLILGPDGEKLSKRHGAPDLSALREATGGPGPDRVVATLARSVGLLPPDVAAIPARELIPRFRLDPAMMASTEVNRLDVAALR